MESFLAAALADTFWSAHGPLWRELALDVGRSRSCTATAQPAIPRILHHIWLGGPIPARLGRLVKSWQKLHPDWLHLTWEDADVLPLQLFNQTAFDSAPNQGQRSDILRYEILDALGGAYVDVDVQCVGSLAALHTEASFYCGISNTGVFELNNAVIGSVPGHACVLSLMRAISRRQCDWSASIPPGEGEKDFSATIEHTGPGVLTRTVMPLLLASERQSTFDGPAITEGRSLLSELQDFPAEVDAARLQRSRSLIIQSALNKVRARDIDACRVLRESMLVQATGAPQRPLLDDLIAQLRSAVVLPKEVFYPLPNTAVVPLPRVALDEETWDAVYSAGAEARCTAAWLRDAVGEAAAPFVIPSSALGGSVKSIGVHYWACTWQRPSAQLRVGSKKPSA